MMPQQLQSHSIISSARAIALDKCGSNSSRSARL
jgi:hypothetical protein